LRGQRTGVRSLIVPLICVGLGTAACATTPRTPAPVAARVLGQQTGSPQVVGQPAPPGTGELGAVSCADAGHCWAVGVAGPNAGSTTTTDGTTTPITVIAATDNGGLTWAAQSLHLAVTPELSGISCPTVALCMAVGSTGAIPGLGIVLTTRDGGTTWTPAAVPTGAFDLTSVQCTSVTDCTAVLSDGTNIWSAQTVNFGHSWQQEGNLPEGFQDPRDISCSGPVEATGEAVCLVAGYAPTSTGHGQGAIAISDDGGETWTSAGVPTDVGVLQNVTCATSGLCLAVGTTSTTVSDVVPAQGELLTSANKGATWTLSPAIPPVQDIFGVACPLPLVCAIVGTQWVGHSGIGTGAVAKSIDGGGVFTKATTAYVHLTLTAVACPTAFGCVAVGGDTVARITLSKVKAPRSSSRRSPPR